MANFGDVCHGCTALIVSDDVRQLDGYRLDHKVFTCVVDGAPWAAAEHVMDRRGVVDLEICNWTALWEWKGVNVQCTA